ncbi:MAG: hypothetical protein M3P98_01305 [bacterium]|nr:hypothetical protein [bacterium]
MTHKLRRLFGQFLMITVVGGFAVFAMFREQISDWQRLRSYEPPISIQRLSDNIDFTEKGERLFYLGQPVIIADPTTFNKNCDIDEFSIILGCFVDDKNIYIFLINDKKLSGIEEVTAAHEMLHNAYSRLSVEEKGVLDTQLRSAYKNLKDKRLKETVDSYEKADPLSVTNELHSLLGSEIRNLPKELEDYYSQYFDDRSKVVSLAEGYSAEFTSRENRIDTIDKRLKVLQTQIDVNKQRINELQLLIHAKERDLDVLLDQDNISVYNADVPTFNSLVNEHNSIVNSAQNMIEEFNSLVRERNSLAVEVQNLIKSIDSTTELIN